jgi:hypothetical protein
MFYRTIKPIFNLRVICIAGRKTRLCQGAEQGSSNNADATVVGEGKKVALKEVWTDRQKDKSQGEGYSGFGSRTE